MNEMEGEEPEEEQALAELLTAEVCFISMQDYLAPWNHEEKTSAVVALCNDLFYWGCADAEALPRDEILNLYRMWKANPKWGTDKWCCLHRHLRPQLSIIRDMKADDFWDAELEAMPAPDPS